MPAIPTDKPKLVNRGPAGLLSKKPAVESNRPVPIEIPPAPINKIAEPLLSMVVDIGTLMMDPDNARLHPERNMDAIKQSLQMYGQLQPVVVRRDKMIVVAGNGRLQGAIELGWTKIAANIIDMDDVTAAGYALADNRSAELAKWDFEVVARLDKLLLDAGHASIGWSMDELEVLRAADWVPPPIDDPTGDGAGEAESLIISFTPDQYATVGPAIAAAKTDGKQDQADCLVHICTAYLAQLEAASAQDS